MYTSKKIYDEINAKEKNEEVLKRHREFCDYRYKCKVYPPIYNGNNTFVVDDGCEIISAKIHYRDNKINPNVTFQFDGISRVFDFELKIGDEYISEKNVCKIEVFADTKNLRKSKNLLFFDEYGGYQKVLNYHPVFTREDLENIVIVFFKDITPKNERYCVYDISIYKSFYNVINIHKVTEIFKQNNIQSFETFRFCRADKFSKDYKSEDWAYCNGKELKLKKLDLPFYIWCNTILNKMDSYDLCDMYSPSNKIPVTSDKLAWNSKKKVLWLCPFGHEWEEEIYTYTNKLKQYYCPSCLVKMPSLERTQFAYSKIEIIKNALKVYGFEDIESLANYVKTELIKTVQLVNEGTKWIYDEGIKDIIFFFVYPNGKQGDINMYICNEYGSVDFICEGLYRGRISSENKDNLIAVSECHKNELTEQMKAIVDKMGKGNLKEYLLKYNVSRRYFSLLELYKVLVGVPPLEYNNLTKGDYKIEAKVIDKIYQDVVAKGKTSSRWVSEQKLYRIIKLYFPDTVYQYRTFWLGHQSLDIFIPSIKVGVEYQGEQHYYPNAFFGGEKGLSERKRLDDKKRELCKKNNVVLIEWKYDIPINDENIKSMLKKWI